MTANDDVVRQIIEADDSRCWHYVTGSKSPRGFTLGGFLAYLASEDHPRRLPLVADAWDIDFNTHTVYLLEVGPKGIDCLRQKRLENLFWLLDSADFRLSLVVYDENRKTTLNVPFEKIALWAEHGAKGVPWSSRQCTVQ